MMKSSEIAVRAHAQRATSRFCKIDCDGNCRLDFEEFHGLLPRQVRAANGMDRVREWFDEADVDSNGTLSIDEFFAWSLVKHTNGHGTGGPGGGPVGGSASGPSGNDDGLAGPPSLRAICSSFDVPPTGVLDYGQFERLCRSVGFGARMHTRSSAHSTKAREACFHTIRSRHSSCDGARRAR